MMMLHLRGDGEDHVGDDDDVGTDVGGDADCHDDAAHDGNDGEDHEDDDGDHADVNEARGERGGGTGVGLLREGNWESRPTGIIGLT
eukprot:8505180-Pyramimonas_sp.AAC.1